MKRHAFSSIFFLVLAGILLSTTGVAAKASSPVVVGSDGWLFLKKELRFLNVGPFWGEQAKTASQAKRVDARDPTPAIVAFNQALAEKGVTLLLVPVPPKALIYSEYVPDADKGKAWGTNLDQYYTILRDKGVRVLDLRQTFYAVKKKQDKLLYCREDTHWSGYGVTVAADQIAKEIESLTPKGKSKYTEKWRNIQISGDLRQMLGDADQKEAEKKETENKETIAIREIVDASGRMPEPDPSSPVLVLGDSHVLVFHDGGDMFARGAGLSDQLAFSLAGPVDVIGVRGSGATPARLSLYRKVQRTGDYWSGKKVVIWCFAAREFTESDGWRVLPIEP